MHNLIKDVVTCAAIINVASAVIFVGYLEIYSLITKDIITSEDRVLIPRISFWAMILAGMIGSTATIVTVLIL